MPDLKTEGIILRSYDYGEGHRIVLIFSSEKGKIRAIAKGSRRPKSKMGAALEPLSKNLFQLHRKNIDSLYMITGCHVLEYNSDIREKPGLYMNCMLICEIIDLLFADEIPEEDVYFLVLTALKDMVKRQPLSTMWLLIFKLLKAAGYRLNLFNCGKCSKRDFKGAFFSASAGSIICRNCYARDDSGWEISGEMLNTVLKLTPDSKISKKISAEIGNLIKKYIKYQFNKDLKSLRFLNMFENGK